MKYFVGIVLPCLFVTACGMGSEPPWKQDIQSGVDVADVFDAVSVVDVVDIRDVLETGDSLDVQISDADTNQPDYGDDAFDADGGAADSAEEPDPVCPEPAGECLISVWDAQKQTCVESTAPDGSPCATGYCESGVCVEDCWTGDCPAGLAILDDCRCRVVPTGSDFCRLGNDNVACENILPGYSWYGQDAHFSVGSHAFKNNGDGTVTDELTGLVWQQSPSTEITIESAATYCESGSDLPGTDWRLPTVRELFTLVDAGESDCMWDPVFGSECSKDSMFWSSTSAYMTANVCTLHPRGNIEACDLADKNPVRCVRGPQPPEDPVADRYRVFEDVVFDRATGLGWEMNDSWQLAPWKDALRECRRKGTGWRLPTTAELVSTMDMTVFEDGCAKWPADLGQVCTDELYFWTSTPNPVQSWYVSVFAVHMSSGHVHENPMDQKFNVRCVRDFPEIGDRRM